MFTLVTCSLCSLLRSIQICWWVFWFMPKRLQSFPSSLMPLTSASRLLRRPPSSYPMVPRSRCSPSMLWVLLFVGPSLYSLYYLWGWYQSSLKMQHAFFTISDIFLRALIDYKILQINGNRNYYLLLLKCNPVFGSRTPNSVVNCGLMTENWKALWRWISKHKQVLNCKTELNFLNFILKIMTLFPSSVTLTLASSEVGTFKVNVPKIK